MNKNTLIPEIYNYCDRWCDRCRFVNRCHLGTDDRVLKMELQMELADDDEELQRVLFNHMKDSLSEVRNLIKEQVEVSGRSWVDFLNDIEQNPYTPPEPTKAQEVLETLALDYGKEVSNWLAKNYLFFQADEREISLADEFSSISVEDSTQVNHIFQVIQYYQFFIGAKIHRMIHGKLDHWDDDPVIQNDWHGSAKVALVSIEKSQKAWLQIYDAYPNFEDEVLDFLAWLDKIKSGILEEVPHAYSFIRPGFDTERI